MTTSVSVNQVPERAFVNAAYVRAVQDAGGVPVLLSPHLDAWSKTVLWPLLDGLLLTGGADVDPARWGEERHPATYDVSPARDALEIELVSSALEDQVPLFAVCRGVQVLNVALGGSLWQDIPTDLPGSLVHSQKEAREQPTHAVKVSGDSDLATIVGRREIQVNSFHHQALKHLGRGLREVARAPDGIIEAIELPDAPTPVFGVQWHPEDLAGHDDAARNLFRALVDAARERATRR
ncbi:MAG: gamma-glutamyl-gamma-aminobutyrate hydrolase family protein [Candidatus Rokubacteria bacterium]|nr:gamma-glutamyl-gamma-aminobutyrate hydrolase family protein [Candidatus Rokubacteria bacterium]